MIDGLGATMALRRLELTITRRIDGLLQGDHTGVLPGPGSEFAEARPYIPASDDVRRMDWNVTARTAEPHVRDVIADRELSTWVMVDGSASMDFGTARMEKRDLALIAVAAVGFLTERAGNRIGAHLLHGADIHRLPARTGRAHLHALLRRLAALERTEPGAKGMSLSDGMLMLGPALRHRGLVVVVSDFLDSSPWEEPLRRLAHWHQVLAVETTDPRELDLPDVGLLTLIDPESGRRKEISTANPRVREGYRAAAVRQRAEIADRLRGAGAAHLRLSTDRDWVRDIAAHILAQRTTRRISA